MATLQETLLAPEIQPRLIADCQELVEHEVADLSGVTGAAVRLACKTVRTFDAGHVRVMIESLLPDVAGALQPYWTLLAITDDRRRHSERPVIVKAYDTVRGSAVKHVQAALPELGTLVQKYQS